MIEVVFLAERPDLTPIVAFWAHLEWWLNNRERDFSKSLEVYQLRRNKERLPLTLIAIQDGLPVGTVSLVESNHLAEYEDFFPWIAAFYVIPQCRKKGIGQRLLDSAVELLIGMNISHVYLHTEKAASYYEKRGWRVVQDNVAGPRGKTTVMKKPLKCNCL